MAAINRAPWTALVDDDGTNLVGSIWNKAAIKTVLLDPIDAALLPLYGTWTPLDASGAGLTFAAGDAWYAKVDRVVFIWANFTFATTANGLSASIAGLPFVNGSAAPGGLYPTYGVNRSYYIPKSSSGFLPMNSTTGAVYTNAQLSGTGITCAGHYLVNPGT